MDKISDDDYGHENMCVYLSVYIYQDTFHYFIPTFKRYVLTCMYMKHFDSGGGGRRVCAQKRHYTIKCTVIKTKLYLNASTNNMCIHTHTPSPMLCHIVMT